MLKLFKIYLIIYFITPSLLIYIAIFTGIKIPFYIEIIPLIFFILYKKKLGNVTSIDLLVFILFIACILFVIRNSNDYGWINNFEVRGVLLIAVNYCIFRVLFEDEWYEDISRTIIKLLEISMYMMLFEFIVINSNGIYTVFETNYLDIYPKAERLYENILMYMKPFGLYPGTHNASIAATISLVYLTTSQSIYENKLFFIASILVFIICFTITGFLVFIFIKMILHLRFKLSINNTVANILYFSALFLMIYFIVSYYSEISQFRSAGEIFLTEDIPFSDAQYIFSIITAFDSLKNLPFGVAVDDIDLFMNEVYITRMAMYYGILIVIFWFIVLIIVFMNLRYQNRAGLFFSISLFALFFSSGHYPSIVSCPLTILVPLALAFIRSRQNCSMNTKSY